MANKQLHVFGKQTQGTHPFLAARTFRTSLLAAGRGALALIAVAAAGAIGIAVLQQEGQFGVVIRDSTTHQLWLECQDEKKQRTQAQQAYRALIALGVVGVGLASMATLAVRGRVVLAAVRVATIVLACNEKRYGSCC